MNPEEAFISKITVDDIISYLKHKGWVRRNSLHKDILVYKRTEEDNKYWEINVPKEEDDPFFGRVVEDAIYRLSMFESRSKSDILIDICNLNFEQVPALEQSFMDNENRDKKPFLEIAYRGKRFDNHLLPLDAFRDVACLDKIIAQVLKERCFFNKNRSGSSIRLKKDSILCVGGIRKGSSIIDIHLTDASVDESIYHDARDTALFMFRDIVDGNLDSLPVSITHNCRQLGKWLRNDELLEFCVEGFSPIPFDSAVRTALAKVSQVRQKKDVILRGEIVSCDKQRRRASILTPSGRVDFEFQFSDPEIVELLTNSLTVYPIQGKLIHNKYLVMVKGEVTQDINGKAVKYIMQSIEKIDPLDSLYRIDEFRTMGNNWDGEGADAPTKEGLDWLASFFAKYPKNLRPPYIFPRENNSVSFQWHQNGSNQLLDFDINLTSHIADGMRSWSDNERQYELHRYRLDNQDEVEQLYQLVREYGVYSNE